MSQIIKIEPKYHERERKYVPTKKGKLSAILKHVLNAQNEFVTPNHPDFIPQDLPKKVAAHIITPREITVMRERVYYLDEELKAIKADIEIRQEAKSKYPVKQTIKTGMAASDDDHTLDRIEFPSKLHDFGPNLLAVDCRKTKGLLKKLFEHSTFIPALRMVSQRTRLTYHPDGDPNIQIEMAFDLLLWGQTAFGFKWQEPKIEIELVKGAEDDKQARHILDREESRLLASFPLESVLHSNPTPGFIDIQERLASPKRTNNAKKWQSLKGQPFFWMK